MLFRSNHLVFADPSNTDARELQADALEQLGYQAESATFRNAYLTGAQELRNGPPPSRPVRRRGLVDALTIEQAFDAMGVRLKSEELRGTRATINWRFTDIAEDWVLGLSNRTLHSVGGRLDNAADVTVTTTRRALLDVVSGEMTFVDGVASGVIAIEGDPEALRSIFGHLDTFASSFAIVEP